VWLESNPPVAEREVPFPQLHFLSELLHRSARLLVARKVEVSECELSGDVLMLEAPVKVAASFLRHDAYWSRVFIASSLCISLSVHGTSAAEYLNAPTPMPVKSSMAARV